MSQIRRLAKVLNEPTRFLAYLVAALKTITDKTGPATFGAEVLSLLESPPPAPGEAIVTALLNEIAAIPDSFLLVLDDYHVIHNQQTNQALAFLLEHLPPRMHLVITTRDDPNLPLARMRVAGQLTELCAADLRFTPEEAGTFLNQVMGLRLTEADVSALEIRTEGWIAGLQLAALSMQGRTDTAHFINSFTGSHRFVMDYLLEEVLHQQPESMQTFLLHTSILDRLCASLCDAVLYEDGDRPATLHPSGQEVLAYIEQANLFLMPLDNERRWYRYHHLFADLLRQRLHQRMAHSAEAGGTDVAALHLRASRWHEKNGSTAEAVRHALAAGDSARVAQLAELAWPAMDGRFQSAVWLEWVQALPEDLVRARPVLSVAYAWAHLNAGEMEAGAARLQDAERWIDPSHPAADSADPPVVVVDEAQFQTLPASIATAKAYIAQALGDIPGSVIHARRALDLLPADDYLRRGPAAGLLGLAQWATGDLEGAYRSLAEAMESFESVGSVAFALSVVYGLTDIRVAQGRLREAIRIYARAKELADRQGSPAPPGTADIHLGLSRIYREQGKPDAARQEMQRSEELGEKSALADWPYRLRRAQAQAAVDEGDADGALALLDEAALLYYPTPVPNLRPIAARKAEVWIAQNRLGEGLAWARGRGLSVSDELSYLNEFEHIVLAHLLIAQASNGERPAGAQEAIELLERLLQAAEIGERTGSVIEILAALALAHQAQNNLPAALAALTRGLHLAEPEGYVRVFVGHGNPMRMLLDEAARMGVSPHYVGRLRAAFGEPEGEPEAERPLHQPVHQPLVEPLSDRELDVLRRLGGQMSGPEIAQSLMISLNTLRTHTKNIYSKLGVNSRRAAVKRAQELGLL